MKTYIVWVRLPSGQIQTYKIQAESLTKAIADAMNEGFHRYRNPADTVAIFACEEGSV